MPVFKDSNNIPPLLPEGDYVFCVVEFDSKISNGPKTRGSEQYELTLEIEPTGKRVFEILTDHPSTNWKIDCFLKAAGVKLAKNESFEFREDVARSSNVTFVDPLGLRGWCRLIQDQLPPREGKSAMTVNKVQVFYTDKAKVERRPMEETPEEERPF